MLKLTYNRQTEKDLKKGSLRPELANLMCEMADLKKTDVCLDMFCGSGAIPKQIVKNFNYNMVFASDANLECVERLKKEYKKNNKKLYLKQKDALNLDFIQNEFIDKIITDPPWNMFNAKEKNFEEFYKDALIEMVRILNPNGKAVVLMGNIETFENALKEIDKLIIEKVYKILVNGKKAKIYILNKTQ